MKRSVQVEIAGVRLSIKSDEGPEYVRELADYVDGRIRELSAASRSSYSLQRVALLVALAFADELLREKDLHERFRRRVDQRLNKLRRCLETHADQLQSPLPVARGTDLIRAAPGGASS